MPLELADREARVTSDVVIDNPGVNCDLEIVGRLVTHEKGEHEPVSIAGSAVGRFKCDPGVRPPPTGRPQDRAPMAAADALPANNWSG